MLKTIPPKGEGLKPGKLEIKGLIFYRFNNLFSDRFVTNYANKLI